LLFWGGLDKHIGPEQTELIIAKLFWQVAWTTLGFE